MYKRNDPVMEILVLCVEEKNDMVTKLFLVLYLVSIYVENMYMCVHMCIMNLHVSVCEYVFSCFPCYFWD